MLISLKNVNFFYPLGDQKIQALKNIDLKIEKGEFIVLAGPSGSGKSTLLNLLGLIEPIQEGTMLFKGKDIRDFPEKEKNAIRRFDLGFIFQSFHLNPALTVFENVEYFLARQDLSPEKRKKRVDEMLEAVGLFEHKNKKPLKLSGGQRQRVAIARAMVKHPQLIIADEPTASLDQKTGKEMLDLLLQFNQKHQTTVLVASHDPMVISKAKRMITMQDGILKDGGQ